MKRRAFLAALSGGLLASCEVRDGIILPPGDLSGPDMALGHGLRDGTLPAPTEERRIGVAIIGAGIGGLSAAWRLAGAGDTDVRLFELEQAPGGNARSGRNDVSAYPLGAHYLPLPSGEARHVRELLSDLGVLQGDPHAALPRYDERYLVHAPQERLYRDGLWHDGLLPRAVASARDLGQLKRFEDIVERLRTERGAGGRRSFAIPSLLAAPGAAADALDRLDMRDWLTRQGFDSPLLHWVCDYGCRDDYGARSHHTSAWAGLHYFASRDGRARDADPHSVLTWPEGNGWLVRRTLDWLAARGAAPATTGALCTRLETASGHAIADIYLAAEKRTVRYRAERVIWAAPAFVLARVWRNPPPGFATAAAQIETSPWLVANLTLDALPDERAGTGLAWDNVLYDSPALGYVVATHQTVRVGPGPTVLTYYLPLTDLPPQEARARLASASWHDWVTPMLAELSKPHPDLRQRLRRIDLWRWPHAMPRPVPGFRGLAARRMLAALHGPLLFAHSDLSGLPLFEEANFAGVRAADLARGLAPVR
jgi:glycine/D-amino acid oxidase-like deaminating enzyme